MLQFEWDLLGSLCRGAKATSSSRTGIAPQVHCDTCNIDFEVNFDRSVERCHYPQRPTRLFRLDGEYRRAARRLVARGGDVVVSAAVHDDPEVADFLSAHSADFEIEKLDMTLKGFYEERCALRRIRKSG